MLAKFSKHIDTHFSFLKDKKVLIAISGGLDSVVLTQLLHQLKVKIFLAHCNFKLRGNASDEDEEFVKKLAEQLQIPIFIKTVETEIIAKQEKLSIQLTARKLRYEWFDQLSKENTFDYVVTAHHADDNLETFLINTIRGTGLDGLTGIPEKNGNIIRPLLPFSREEIEKYATKNSISWREDSSNAEIKYLRNKIRHQVIPVLKEVNPSLLKSFQKTQENLKASRQIIDDRIESLLNEIVIPAEAGIQKINIKKLLILNNPKAYLYQLLKKYNFTEWNDIAHLLEAQSGKQIFSTTHRLVKDRAFLLLTKIHQVISEDKLLLINEDDLFFRKNGLKLKLTTSKEWSTVKHQPSIIIVDKDLLKFPLTVRKWQNGDYFYPFGMQGKKKISKFFKDEKMSILDKENTWLLCSENKIVWVIGERLDDRYKITNTTTNRLKIEII